MEVQVNRSHRTPQAGPSFKKKKARDLTKKGVSTKGKNLKAFSYSSRVKASRHARRAVDISYRKEHAPLANRAAEVAPPYVVAVVGPPGVGKSTLIKSLVKHYTKQTLNVCNGPITVVTGKKRRMTFFECPNHLSAMIDLAKICDLVLLLVDASFGFEMETFEFLNILKNHGFPKVMGVLTHLDTFKTQKALRATKKKLKHRFWTEVVDGAKMFYLSGLINNRYPKRECVNLARFISITKFRPLIWKNTHPFVLGDRYEDLTDPGLVHADPLCDRTV
jgi:ribosome biogenesis protein BMS1